MEKGSISFPRLFSDLPILIYVQHMADKREKQQIHS